MSINANIEILKCLSLITQSFGTTESNRSFFLMVENFYIWILDVLAMCIRRKCFVEKNNKGYLTLGEFDLWGFICCNFKGGN